MRMSWIALAAITAAGCSDGVHVAGESLTSTDGGIPEWVETFDLPDGATSDTGATAWSVTPASGSFEVRGGQFASNFTVDEAVWRSEPITIAGRGPVDVSIAYSGQGALDASGTSADWLRFFYRVDDGAEVQFGAVAGVPSGANTAAVAGVTGSTLQIVVRTRTTAADEWYRWDTVRASARAPSSTRWREDFALPNGTKVDTGDTAWSVPAAGQGTFQVESGAFRAAFTRSQAVWQSEAIDIRGSAVEISARLSWAGTLDRTGTAADYVRFFYRLDGGPEISFGSYSGTPSTSTVRSGRLTGSSLVIVVRTLTTASDERYVWDDVAVSGVAASGAGGLDARPSNTTCVAPARPALPNATVSLQRAFGGLPAVTRPLYITQAPGSTSWYLIEQPGRVRRFSGDGSNAQVVLDITDRVDDGPNEAGLLGVAFHPNFATNGWMYLSYTGRSGGLQSRLSRFTTTNGGASFDPASEVVLLRQAQPFDNHNGGWIGFGPDGYLYMALGDGGSAGDPQNNGQNLNTLLGKILRLDVSAGTTYASPPDNPFAAGGGRPEIWAYGVRNPWRLSFDRATGTLWAGDVGQNQIEEVDVIERGGNYGWRIKEGNACFNPTNCNGAGLINPVAQYTHSEGQSITGGYVYRGTAIPDLVGAYVYGDFVSGRIWALYPDGASSYRVQRLLDSGRSIASFAEGADGELYLVDIQGAIYRFAAASTGGGSSLPALLSQTGCVDPADPRRPAAGMIPYDVNAPLWSDGAAKERYFAIPNGTTIGLGANGDFDFPIGSVLTKTFFLGGTRVETRLFMRHTDGSWAGYTYRWNAAQTDAELLPADARVTVGGQTWLIPSRGQCMQCHTGAAGHTLGLELGQLNRNFTYPVTGRTANQVTSLAAVGFFTQALPAAVPRFAPYDGPEPAADRARSYLHSNCSNCHRPTGPGGGNMDLRHDVSFAATNLCNVTPSHGALGVTDARLVAPGSPARSIVPIRMRSLSSTRMPPLATERVDMQGVSLIESWIQSVTSCP